MSLLQTAERVSQFDESDNYVYQRSILAYVEASKLVNGRVLEIGTGSGYGIDIIAPSTEKFVTVDKFQTDLLNDPNRVSKSNIEFIKMTVPPLEKIADKSFDFVISFQVIEHIEDDKEFVKEIYRVLKNGGKFILSTPNKKMSLTRNPWHVREYTVAELENVLLQNFESVEKLGVFGNDKVMQYYQKNKEAVRKITRFDILNLQYILPRQVLQIPYDILNRLNRRSILKKNRGLVIDISMDDYFLEKASEECLDLFYMATKK